MSVGDYWRNNTIHHRWPPAPPETQTIRAWSESPFYPERSERSDTGSAKTLTRYQSVMMQDIQYGAACAGAVPILRGRTQTD